MPSPRKSAPPGRVGALGDWGLALLFLLLVVAAYADPLLTRRAFVGRDIVPYNLPLEKAVHDSWSRGEVPVWWNAVSGGRPLLPNPNAGVFYPARFLLSFLSFPSAMRIFPILHWILGGWGMLRLLRVAGGSRAAAWIAAVSFVFSGVVVSEVFYSNFAPGAALLPWSLWALARPAARPIRRILPVALVYGLMLLAGDAFSVALALLSAALWLALETPRGDRGAEAARWAVGLAAAALLALPQWLATALLAPETHRMVGGIPLREALGFTIPAARLFELVVPNPFGPSGSMDTSLDWGDAAFRRFFATLFVGPIAVLGLFAARSRSSPPGLRFARWLTGITVALALSGHLVPEAWGNLPSPIPLRYPEKFMLGATLGLALAAGLAVDRLRAGAHRRALWAAAGILALAAVASRLAPDAAGRLAAASVGAPLDARGIAARGLPYALAAGGLLWAASAGAAAMLSHPGRRPLTGALVLLTAVPILADRGIAQCAHEALVYSPTRYARVLARRDPGNAYRTLDESIYRARPATPRDAPRRADLAQGELFRESWFFYTQSLWGRGTVFNADLDAGDLSRVESLRRVCALAAAQADSGPFFAALSLRFGIRLRGQESVAGFEAVGAAGAGAGDSLRAWDENPSAAPHIRLVESWAEAPGPVEALAALPRLGPGRIVIETGRRASGSARRGTVRVLSESPGALSLATECADPAWLFVLRGDWSYRTVLLDGRPLPVFPAQIAFSAVPVPPGTHRIEWREDAPGLTASRWGPLAGALLLLGVGAAGRFP